MRFPLGIRFLVLLSMVLAVSAKPNLPVELTSRTLGEDRSSVRVLFTKAATDVTVTVSSTGSATMKPVTRKLAAVAKGETLEFSPVQTVKDSFGGVAVHVQANFGGDQQIRTVSHTLTKAPSTPASVRARKRGDGKGSPGVIVLPAKTTVKPLER